MSRPRHPPGSTAVFQVKNRSGKKPLATYLGSRLGVVDAWAEDLIAHGHVVLDGAVATPGATINLSAGPHILEVHFPDAWPRHMAATEMPLSILYEDECLVVLDKPAGIVVHPARGHLDNQTLQNGVRHRYRHLLALPETCIGPAHRLDKDTSGVIVFALKRPVYIDLVEQFAGGAPHKEYLAILDGAPDFDTTVCDLPIGPDAEKRGLGTIVPEDSGGKKARTDFFILARGRDWALARAVPHTGRPHQIRIHAAALGLPVAGDKDYNPEYARRGLERQALHAWKLSLRHPTTGTPLAATAELPADMHNALHELEGTSATFPMGWRDKLPEIATCNR